MKMPKKILLYVCDESGETPVLAVATSLADIPEDSNGNEIGEYELVTKSKLEVKRELKPCR